MRTIEFDLNTTDDGSYLVWTDERLRVAELVMAYDADSDIEIRAYVHRVDGRSVWLRQIVLPASVTPERRKKPAVSGSITFESRPSFPKLTGGHRLHFADA